MSAQQVVFQYLSAGTNTLTVPPGFSNQVLVYAWGAGGGDGYNGPTGGGGGFAQGIITINSGDTIEISVGSHGEVGPRDGKGIGGLSYNSLISFNGGPTGTARPQPYNDDQNYGAGGGGGAASAVLVNGVPMLVAAGGGGGGGGRSYQTGTIGTAGGTTVGTPLFGNTLVTPYPVNAAEFTKFINAGLRGEIYGDYATTFTGWVTLSSPLPSIITSNPLFAGYNPSSVVFVDYNGQTKTSSTNINVTSQTVGSTTYTRGNVAYYTGTTTFSVPGISYTANVVFYNYTITSLSEVTTLNDRPEGGRSQDGYTVGGGGGGGYPYGGAGGETRGDDAGASSGGYGGQSYANSTVLSAELRPGTTSVAGGTDLAIYPGARRGYAGYDGAVIVIFTKGFRAWIKNSNVWKEISNAWVKVANTTVRTTSSPVVTTVNYTPTPGTLGGLVTELNNVIAGGALNVTGWYTFNPNLTDFIRDSGLSVTELPDDVRAVLNTDLGIDIAGENIYSTSEDTITSITVGGNTYTRGSLSYSGPITVILSLPSGTINWTTTVNMYNFSKTFNETSTTETVVSEGGWKRITQAWVKENDVWQSIQTGVSLTPIPSSADTVTVNINIASNTNNYVLSDFLSGTSYYPGRSIINLTVNANILVGSTSVGSPALLIDGLAAGDTLNLINNGNIAGAGGRGGAAGSYTSVTSGGSSPVKGQPAPKGGYSAGTTVVTSVPGRPGEVGGPALYVDHEITLINNGTIAGGGGGGGGGGGPTGGQGGGGAGRVAGAGANNGTLTAGGAGAGLGGAGGARGTAGSAGTNDTNAGGVGGTPGAAILGIDKVTITTAGTIIGEQKVIAREVG